VPAVTAARPLLLVALLAAGCVAKLPVRRPIDEVAPRAYGGSVTSDGAARDIAQQRAMGNGLVHAPELTAALQRVLDRLIASTPVTGVPSRVYVQADGSWNAITTSAANIYLSIGLVRHLSSEDEAAAVLAHELAHVVLGHHASDAMERMQEHGMILAAAGMTAWQQLGAKNGRTRELPVQAQQALLAEWGLMKLTSMVIAPGWNRQQEQAADLLAVDLLVRAGYNRGAVGAILVKQAEVDAAHPQPDPMAILASIGWKPVEIPQGGDAGDKAAVLGIKLGEVLAGGILAQMARRHPDAQARAAVVALYVQREYATAEVPDYRTESWQQAMEAPAIKSVLAAYDAADDAQRSLESGDVRAAEQYARQAVSGPAADHAHPCIVMAATQRRSGRLAEAQRSLGNAIEGPEPAFATYLALATITSRQGRQDEAVRILERSYQVFQGAPEVIVTLIGVYQQVGRHEDAKRLTAQCIARYPGRALAKACNGQATPTTLL